MAGPNPPRTPADLAEACATRFARRYREWLADPASGATDVLRFSIACPTAARASGDPTGTADWIRRWREFESSVDARATHGAHEVEVAWADRRLPGFGVVALPQRVEIRGDRAIARIGGRAARWETVRARADDLLRLGPDHSELSLAAAATAPLWEKLPDRDMERLLAVCRWVLEHPTEGLRAREVAVPGVDTKWIETRIRLVEQLVDAARSGRDSAAHDEPPIVSGLGLKRSDLRVRMRILDPAIPFPLRDVESPVDQLAELWDDGTGPQHLVVVENLTTFLALPPLPGAVALFGRGFAVDAVAALPWALAALIVYWGDLDSHGFAILDRLRHHAPHAVSVLMDVETLDTWRDLTVTDPRPTRREPTRLTADEVATLELLTARGDLRLEQERIAWDWVLPRLRSALG